MPLKRLGMMQSEVKWVRLGDYITQRREKNNNYDAPIYGVTRDGFIPPKQKEADTSMYNTFYLNDFVFNPARMEINSIYLNDFCDRAICSSLYEVFYINDTNVLLPHFLLLFLKRNEFARHCEYIGHGSAREYCRISNISDIKIPLPSKSKQQELVNAWKGLRTMKAENEDLSEPLMQLCQSYLQDLKKRYKMVEIGPFIEECNERNSDGKYGIPNLRGVTSEGVFDDTKANTDGLKFNNYKIVKKDSFAYNPSRINIGSIAKSEEEVSIISPMYVVFKIRDGYKKQLNSDFMNLWFKRSEFQRSTLFFATGSVRDTFDYDEMRRVRIPLPPIEIQQAIVNIYQCAKEAKEIAKEADELSKGICSALVRSAVN